jgi:hypothetical protein
MPVDCHISAEEAALARLYLGLDAIDRDSTCRISYCDNTARPQKTALRHQDRMGFLFLGKPFFVSRELRANCSIIATDGGSDFAGLNESGWFSLTHGR